MKDHPLRTTVIGSYPFPGWLEFGSQNLDVFGSAETAPRLIPQGAAGGGSGGQAADGNTEGDADGAARLHAASARDEAARKLASNHERVLLDLTNPSAELNIDGKPLTQRLTLRRVPAAHREYADGFLIEVTRRLLGNCRVTRGGSD